MDPRYRMVIEVDIGGRTYVLPVKYMKEDGRADGEKTNYILREVRGEILKKVLDGSVKIRVRSNVPPLGIFALAVADDLAGEVDGLGNWKITVGTDSTTPGLMLDRFDSFFRRLSRVSLVYMLGTSVPR